MSFAAILGLALFLFPSLLAHAVFHLPQPFPVSFIAVLGWMLLQPLFIAGDTDAMRIETVKMGAYGLLFCLTAVQPRERLELLSRGIVAAAVLITLYGFFQTFSGHEHVLWRHKEAHTGFVTGTFMNRNHFAGFLELALGVAAAHFFAITQKKRIFFSGLFFVGMVLLIAGLFASGSRSGILSFFIFFALFFVFYLKNVSASVRWLTAAGFLFVLTALVLLPGKTGMMRFFDVEEPFFILKSERWQVWKDTVRMILQHPWIGIGAGNFQSVFPHFQSETLVFNWDHAHNGYLELLAELGVPAFVVLGGGWGVLGNALRAAGRNAENPQRIQVLALSCGAGAFLLHGMTDFNFSIPSNMFLFSFIAAYLTVFAGES